MTAMTSTDTGRVAALCFSLALILAGCGGDEGSADGAIAITNAVIIDGLGGEPISSGVVLIEGDRITAVGATGTVDVPDDARIINAQERAVIPGLADMHVHMVGGWDGVSTDMLGYQRYLDALLYSGVTTVLDVGNVLPYLQQIRAEVDAGRLAGPRIHMVGPLIDGPRPIWPPLTYSAQSPESIRPYVEQLSGAGVDALKGYAGLTEAMVDSLVEAAREHSLPVVVDLGNNSAAIRSGVTALAHAPSGDWSDDDVAAMVDMGTASITTLAVIESFSRRRMADVSFLDHDLISRTTPPWFLDDLRAEATRDLSDTERQRAQATTERLGQAMRNLRRMHEAGVLIVAGTDAPYPGVFQGEGIHRELELLVEAGLSPVQAIAAATHNAARLMGAESEWGSIRPGLAADLVLVHGNPSEDVGATRNIVAVIQAGVILSREGLEFDAATDSGARTVGSVASF